MRTLHGKNLRVAATVGLAAAVCAALLAGSGLALPQPYYAYFFGANMVRAEVILKTKDSVRDYRLDRGRVRAVSANSVTLRARDGLMVVVPVAAGARVQINGRPVGGLFALRRGMEAVSVRQGGAPAESVHAASKRDVQGLSVPKPLTNYLFGSSMMRTEAVLMTNTAILDYRIDRGRVRAVTSNSVTLKERDGLVVTVPISSATKIHVNGHASGVSGLRLGMEAMAIRDGDRPADTIQVPPRR